MRDGKNRSPLMGFQTVVLTTTSINPSIPLPNGGAGRSIGKRGAKTKRGISMSECSIESDGKDLFVVFDGVKIAKRGQPKTPQPHSMMAMSRSRAGNLERRGTAVELFKVL